MVHIFILRSKWVNTFVKTPYGASKIQGACGCQPVNIVRGSQDQQVSFFWWDKANKIQDKTSGFLTLNEIFSVFQSYYRSWLYFTPHYCIWLSTSLPTAAIDQFTFELCSHVKKLGCQIIEAPHFDLNTKSIWQPFYFSCCAIKVKALL